MILTAFRVQNYKKIADTGRVSVGDLTCFVGKNEAGKSALFRGLSKLNPSDNEPYDGLKEFPRSRFTDEFEQQDWLVATGWFDLDDTDIEELSEISSLCRDVKGVEVTRRYSGELLISFEPPVESQLVTKREILDLLETYPKLINGWKSSKAEVESMPGFKELAHGLVQQLKGDVNSSQSVTAQLLTNCINKLRGLDNEDWQTTYIDQAVNPIEDLLAQLAEREKLRNAKSWVQDNLPKFLYFDNYDVLRSAIYLPTFVGQLQARSLAPEIRTAKCLFQHVGLDIKKLHSLGRHQNNQGETAQLWQQIDEAAIRASSASIALTNKFSDWWIQRHHKFEFKRDGDYFRVWVSDDKDPSPVELDQRSRGMQFFFSFYIVFLVEAQDAHENCILLLDEPGLYLHGTAQNKIVEFLRKISADNQTMYTTHSPFMVDADRLECARAVFENADTGFTEVSEDVWPRDRDSLFPLQAALGYQLAQSLFVSKRQLIVEGITDYWILKALDSAVSTKGGQGLRDDIVIVPSAGVSKLLPLASMLIGHDVEIAALLDGDEPGRKAGKKLQEKLLQDEQHRCVFIGDILDNEDAELEDIFALQLYLDAVKEAYGDKKLALSKADQEHGGNIACIEAMFERKQLGRLEKWRPAALLRDWIMEGNDKIPEEVYDLAKRIFGVVNALFCKTHTASE